MSVTDNGGRVSKSWYKSQKPYIVIRLIQWASLNTKSFLELSGVDCFPHIVIVVGFKGEFVDSVGEIVFTAIVSEIRNEFVEVSGTTLERTPRREVDVPNDLVNPHPPSNIASFVRLLLQLICPTFFSAL